MSESGNGKLNQTHIKINECKAEDMKFDTKENLLDCMKNIEIALLYRKNEITFYYIWYLFSGKTKKPDEKPEEKPAELNKVKEKDGIQEEAGERVKSFDRGRGRARSRGRGGAQRGGKLHCVFLLSLMSFIMVQMVSHFGDILSTISTY